jgi:hypothetical protein
MAKREDVKSCKGRGGEGGVLFGNLGIRNAAVLLKANYTTLTKSNCKNSS